MIKRCIVLIAFICCLLATSCGAEKFNWDEIYLNSYLPKPVSEHGSVSINSLEELAMVVKNTTYSDYQEYKDACISKGINIDGEDNLGSYEAFTADGGKLHLEYYESNKSMDIEFEILVYENVQWHNITLGYLLPTPKSTVGRIDNNNPVRCGLYLGNTSKSEYEKYVKECIKKGFNVGITEQDNCFFAKDKYERELTIEYYGCDVIHIELYEHQYDINLTVNYLDNEFVNSHDVGILVDDSYEGALCIGENDIYELSLAKGKHTIHIRSDEYDNVSEFLEFEVTGDKNLEIEISTEGKKISAMFIDEESTEVKDSNDENTVDTNSSTDNSLSNDNTKSNNTNQATTTRYCVVDSCTRKGIKEYIGIAGQTEYYCYNHYNEMIDMINDMEDSVGSSEYSKHTCEECSREGTHSIIGLSGNLEYYCSTHYSKLQDMMDEMGL